MINQLPTIRHETITLERHYDAAPERVFRAFSDPAVKAIWFHGPDDWPIQGDTTFDFREGGLETSAAGPPGGDLCHYTARYVDIVPGERIVFTYDMSRSGRRMSVSVQSIELSPEDGGTRLRLVDQGAYLDGLDDPRSRRAGIEPQLDQLAKALTEG
jgi:uncharacterized protein YndB with AHSA1/START domain